MKNNVFTNHMNEDAIVGCLVGQAVGDAMGLPMENLSRRRIQKCFPNLDKPRFFLGHGMGSDDTEHACITAQAILRSGGDAERFQRSLAWGLRWWFLSGPPGIGLATLKACLKLCAGFPPGKSGVKSAGNGPAMRAAIIGVCNGPCDLTFASSYSTIVTHTDKQARFGALLISILANQSTQSRNEPGKVWHEELEEMASRVQREIPESDLTSNMNLVVKAAKEDLSVSEFAIKLGLNRGVTGYIAHTVPVAIFAFCRHSNNYRAAVESVIRCGGDTDTVAAITGALVGARVGKGGIPQEWIEGYRDWPRSLSWIERLGRELAKDDWRSAPQRAIPLAWYWIPFRNAFFFVIVLGHVFKRCLPPY